MSTLRLLCSGLTLLCANLIFLTVPSQADVIRASNCLPPVDSAYLAQFGGADHQQWGGNLAFEDPVHSKFDPPCHMVPTMIGQTLPDIFNSTLSGVLKETGKNSVFITAPAAVQVEVTLESSSNGVEVFKTQIVQFDVSGGDLPPGVMLRQDPTNPTLGMTTITKLPDGLFDIHSFFDVFTDLSLDGGKTWIPDTIPGHVEVENVPEPETIALLGSGLLGLAVLLRRRRAPKD